MKYLSLLMQQTILDHFGKCFDSVLLRSVKYPNWLNFKPISGLEITPTDWIAYEICYVNNYSLKKLSVPEVIQC